VVCEASMPDVHLPALRIAIQLLRETIRQVLAHD
jgi:hypothetical protein